MQKQSSTTSMQRYAVQGIFTHTRAFSGFSVNDIEKARNFYGEVLGLKITEEMEGSMAIHIEGSSQPIFVYPKKDHVAATFTILNFPVVDVESVVKQLTMRGIKFERYEGDLKTDEQGIFRGGPMLMAWFKDPAGNILSVIEEETTEKHGI